MDVGDFKIHDWLMIGGGVAMLILGFALDWTSVSGNGFSASGDGPFDYFLTGGVAWLLVVAVGILAPLGRSGRLAPTLPWPVIYLGMSAIATLLMVIQIILGPRFDTPFGDVSRGIGMYGALIWSAISLAGAYLNFADEGGTLSDLTDVEKLRGGTGGDEPPPPPPAD